MRLRLTVRGVALACAAIGLGVAAYWTLQGAFLVPAVLAGGIVVAGLLLLLLAPAGTEVVWRPPTVAVEGVDLDVPVRLPDAYAGGWWRPQTSLDPVTFSWDRLESSATHLRVYAPHRGVHRLGPVRARRKDPLGAWLSTRRLETLGELVVGPRVTPLQASAVLGHGIDAAVSRVGQGDLVDQLVRDYRPGDPVRRIHWRQTARHGDLMVRQEQPPATPRVVIVLDTLADGWRDDDEFDEGVRAFASLCMAVASQGLQVEVQETGVAQLGDGLLASRTALLDACARLEVARMGVDRGTQGPTIVVAGLGSPPMQRILADLDPGSTVWSVTDDPRTVGRMVRHVRWNGGHPYDARRPA
ncbi:DUF58 domain-containing protein [Agrococcus jejuensis]|uniref:DUF58 domain-containing protein n=1 Tax=Agrococcus jejuensis TaxID=399736 RepID=A0A1G8B1I7_9MICO|nr:DUF58 domain-containing protein [Agrococcus jejuensis]SDH26994.1 Protein of unknown function DUF58 [Agrococcus jejuensis]